MHETKNVENNCSRGIRTFYASKKHWAAKPYHDLEQASRLTCAVSSASFFQVMWQWPAHLMWLAHLSSLTPWQATQEGVRIWPKFQILTPLQAKYTHGLTPLCPVPSPVCLTPFGLSPSFPDPCTGWSRLAHIYLSAGAVGLDSVSVGLHMIVHQPTSSHGGSEGALLPFCDLWRLHKG